MQSSKCKVKGEVHLFYFLFRYLIRSIEYLPHMNLLHMINSFTCIIVQLHNSRILLIQNRICWLSFIWCYFLFPFVNDLMNTKLLQINAIIWVYVYWQVLHLLIGLSCKCNIHNWICFTSITQQEVWYLCRNYNMK